MGAADHLNFDAMARSGRITDQDVLALRRAYFEDGQVDLDEAKKIFSLGETCQGESDEWPRFLVEAMTDYIVHQAAPRGYVSEAQTGWLIEHISRDGHISSRTELELLVKIIETATEVPENLELFAYQTIKDAILQGDGQLIGDAKLQPGIIGKAEVDLIRRLIYAIGGSNNIAISRSEAELLFDLNDATVEEQNHPEWSDLFAKAILNHLMAANHYQAMSRERALRVNEWLNEPNAGVAGFFGKMFSSEMLSIKNFYTAMSDSDWRDQRLERMLQQQHDAEAITACEASWLAARIGRDGQLHENEKAVVQFIRDECPELHHGLEKLLARI